MFAKCKSLWWLFREYTVNSVFWDMQLACIPLDKMTFIIPDMKLILLLNSDLSAQVLPQTRIKKTCNKVAVFLLS